MISPSDPDVSFLYLICQSFTVMEDHVLYVSYEDVSSILNFSICPFVFSIHPHNWNQLRVLILQGDLRLIFVNKRLHFEFNKDEN
jgi:hypothetical protein